MKLAIAYSTKDQVELTEQTLPSLAGKAPWDLFWCDGSRTEEGQRFFEAHDLVYLFPIYVHFLLPILESLES